MNKLEQWAIWIMIGIVLFVLTGCANTQSMREAKDEQAFRNEVMKMKKGNERDEKLLETVEERSYKEEILRCENYMTTKDPGTPEATRVFDQDSCRMEEVQRVEATPIGMPQEWLDQWPSLRDPNYVEPVKEEVFEITDPCEQLGPAYC